jgi:hypothetical protein
VDLRVKPQKSLNSNSPKRILFVKQREFPKFPQNKTLQLVTQFSVCLRVLPFSELSPKIQLTKNLFKTQSNPQNSAIFRSPIIKGLPADLILTATRFNITHLLIYFFIQKSFSHKFLKHLLNVQSILSYEFSNTVLY